MKTIVTVLSSSISCNVLRSGKQEVLQIGSTISCHDCVGLIEASVSVLGKIEGHGEFDKFEANFGALVEIIAGPQPSIIAFIICYFVCICSL